MFEKVKARLAASKYLSWTVVREELWIFKRHNVALGAAIGVFFGFLVPLAQIPASAIVSVLLRANIGVAAVSTLITNPITFGPLYYAAYKFGEYVTGIKFTPLGESESLLQWIGGVGAPLVIGLSVFAVIGFCLTYGLVYSLFNIRDMFKKPNLWRQ